MTRKEKVFIVNESVTATYEVVAEFQNDVINFEEKMVLNFVADNKPRQFSIEYLPSINKNYNIEGSLKGAAKIYKAYVSDSETIFSRVTQLSLNKAFTDLVSEKPNLKEIVESYFLQQELDNFYGYAEKMAKYFVEDLYVYVLANTSCDSMKYLITNGIQIIDNYGVLMTTDKDVYVRGCGIIASGYNYFDLSKASGTVEKYPANASPFVYNEKVYKTIYNIVKDM